MIVFPLDNFDSYVDIISVDEWITKRYPAQSWLMLGDGEKESKLILATDEIRQHYDITEEAVLDNKCDIVHAMSLMVISNEVAECNNIKSVDDGITKVVYKDDVSVQASGISGIPIKVEALLLGCAKCGDADVLMYTY